MSRSNPQGNRVKFRAAIKLARKSSSRAAIFRLIRNEYLSFRWTFRCPVF